MTQSLALALRPLAEADLAGIWDMLAAPRSGNEAQLYLADIGATLTALCTNPEMARRWPEFIPLVRLHPFSMYLAIYRASDTTLEVIRILPARCDWTAPWDDLGEF